ncbi:MAG: MFS transporter [Smithellaceae bacterium]
MLNLPRDLQLFLAAMFVFGFSQSIVDATFNNYLSETFSISDFQRGFLELPRELPGFLVVFVAAMFFFLCSRRLAVLANLLCALGILFIGIYSPDFSIMLIWLFIFSIGQHLFIPLNQSIGMELARDGKTGRRLGQLSGIANFSAIIGSFAVLIGFKFYNLDFKNSYIIAFLGFLAVALLIFMMQKNKPLPAKTKFKLKKEYTLFYWLNILYGTRKQIFLTFAPWVLVTIFKQKTQVVATLLMIGGIIGIFFKPMLGRAIDHFGERFILTAEAVILIFVCLTYGFARNVFPETAAMYITFFCYVIDQLLMSVSMARATYLQKIAVKPEDVNQTLTMGVTIDHAFSITVALLGGFIWLKWGYQYVFLLGVIIAVINTFSALRVNASSTIH